jgi:hypothetical protein
MAESILSRFFSTPGEYLIRVRGLQDVNQFYQLDFTVSEAPAAGTSADLNLDGESTIADWSIFVANAYADLAGLSPREAFQRGDLDGDGDSDFGDFRFFKSAFDAVNGPGALANIIQVAEPQILLLLGFAAFGGYAGRQMQRKGIAT